MSWQKVSRVNSERGREDKWRGTNVFQEEIIGKICSFQKYSYFCPTPVSPIAGWRERHILEDVFHAFIFYLLNLATSTREDNSNKGVCVVWLYTYADQAGMFLSVCGCAIYFIQAWADWRCLSSGRAMREPKRWDKQESDSPRSFYMAS